jgi:polar amino acid transport system permease protein
MLTMLASVDWHIVWERLFHPDHLFLRALWTTVYMAVAGQSLGVVLGLFAALMRLSRFPPLRWLSGFYVLIFRGTPLLVQIFFIYFGVDLLFGPGFFFGHDLIPSSLNFGIFRLDGAVFAGILALALNEGAYMREIIRAGIDAVDKGQMEAARSLGMTHGLAMRRIILPQAARVIVPPTGNEFNAMLKNTSLVFTIGVYEMFADADIHYSQTFKPVEFFGTVAIWYLVLTSVWTVIQTQIERKLAASERGDELSFWERLTETWSPVTAWARGAR